MTEEQFRHLAIIQTIIAEYENHRIPRLLRIKDRLDTDEVLRDYDIDFLDHVIHDTEDAMSLQACAPELQEFCLHVVHLHHDITSQALLNEKSLH